MTLPCNYRCRNLKKSLSCNEGEPGVRGAGRYKGGGQAGHCTHNKTMKVREDLGVVSDH